MLLRVGSTGEEVKKIQALLGVDIVGKFGPKTEAAVKGWQSANGLTADGVVGPNTWAKMFATKQEAPIPAPIAQPVVQNTNFKLDKLKGHIPQAVIDQIPDTAARFGITNTLRLAHFLSQTSHETGGFKAFSENLNYGSKGLLTIFGKYFKTIEKAKAYERKPEKIANLVYSNRMGNGPESSGEGWKYRGRGALQTTGKFNYQDFADFMGMPEIMNNPDIVATKYALASAGFFFKKNNLWTICDQGASEEVIKKLTKRINGGQNGILDRIKHFKEFYHLLA
jgi:putative chitinase